MRTFDPVVVILIQTVTLLLSVFILEIEYLVQTNRCHFILLLSTSLVSENAIVCPFLLDIYVLSSFRW